METGCIIILELSWYLKLQLGAKKIINWINPRATAIIFYVKGERGPGVPRVQIMENELECLDDRRFMTVKFS